MFTAPCTDRTVAAEGNIISRLLIGPDALERRLMKKRIQFIHHFPHPLDQSRSTLLQTGRETMQCLPLRLQVEHPIILPIKNAWFPAKKRNNLLRILGSKIEAMIIAYPKIPLDPPNRSLGGRITQSFDRRHFSEQ